MDTILETYNNEKKLLKTRTAALLEKRDELRGLVKQVEELQSRIDMELFNRCATSDSRALQLLPEGRVVKIITVRDFKEVPLKFAEKYKAVKIVVETRILKALADTGVMVPGIKEREQLYVK